MMMDGSENRREEAPGAGTRLHHSKAFPHNLERDTAEWAAEAAAFSGQVLPGSSPRRRQIGRRGLSLCDLITKKNHTGGGRHTACDRFQRRHKRHAASKPLSDQTTAGQHR